MIRDRETIESTICLPQAGYPEAKTYNFSNPAPAGTSNVGTLDGCDGQAGLRVSAHQYIGAFRYDDSIMAPADRAIMDSEKTGWNGASGVTDGTAYSHGGAWNRSGGRRTLTCVMKVPNGVDTSTIIDSQPPSGTCFLLRQAYEAGMPD